MSEELEIKRGGFVIEDPEQPEPEQEHDNETYHHIELVKKKGRRKKSDPREYGFAYIPWELFNVTELIALCLRSTKSARREQALWLVLHQGIDRETLIGLIRGEVDPETLPINPIHEGRQKLAMMIREYWRYIWSQLSCNTCCWECPDAKALECVLENQKSLPEGDTWDKK